MEKRKGEGNADKEGWKRGGGNGMRVEDNVCQDEAVPMAILLLSSFRLTTLVLSSVKVPAVTFCLVVITVVRLL
eukprot:736341-Hanusia_phi.AAC.1